MNVELKALLTLALDLFFVGKDVVEKADFVTVLVPKLIKLTTDIPCAVIHVPTLMAEIEALPGSAQEVDLMLFIQTQVGMVTTDAKAQAIVKASLKLVVDLIQDGLALEAAIKS